MKIELNLDNDFEKQVAKLKEKYGEDMTRVNGFADEQLDYTEFIDNFIDSDNVANATIDPNANVNGKDVRSLIAEMSKPHMKLLSFNKIYYELKKKHGKKFANKWLEDEWTGALYMHDAPSTSFYSYCFSGETRFITSRGVKRLDACVGMNVVTLNINGEWEESTVKSFGKQKLMKLSLCGRNMIGLKSIYVTAEHKWIVYDRTFNKYHEIETQNLIIGMKIPRVTETLSDKDYWEVASVEETNEEEEVFCVVAPKTQTFVLEDYVLTHNCYAYELQPLAERGLYFQPKSNTRPPMHLTTFMAHLREYIVWVSNRSAGACALPGFFVYTWYFWHKDVESGYYLKDPEYYRRQLFQQFIFEVNQIHTRVTQSAYTNLIIMDRNYITEIFGDRTFPDGTYVIDHVDDIIEHQKAYMETEAGIRHEVFHTFPVYTYSLLFQNGKFVDEEFARWCSDNNTEWYDSNFYVGDSVTNLASCCRMLNDISKQKQFQSSIGGSLVEIGSVKVSTINLMRIALESVGDKKKFIKILRDRVDENMKVLDTVRHIIKRNIEKGLLPNYSFGVINLDKQTTTNGLTAMYEAIRHMGMTEKDALGNVSYTREGVDFACEIMDTVNAMQDNAGFDYNVSLEIVPAESANVKLCKKDNIIYDRDHDFIYSNQWTALMAKCDIEQRIKLSSILDRKAGGGQILHVNLDGERLTKDQAWELLNHIANSGVIYFAFNPKLSLCEKKHTFYGDICPSCGGPKTDEASRIVGYLVPTSTYSSERKDEYLAREWYTVEGDGIL